ncbi:MFS transporter [Hyunsoonleella sp. SJ7]|uniref:MFS transporter n=1 Tax=Hyunsoonleella aquatilis TaxID=2762758 RepID=A0A923HIN1_9FLAO|nr:MFS transporter [Hyunsoonleella aquatilis]MBC3760005.1 MFS transporter [Hyunsoonleella aquatilis]
MIRPNKSCILPIIVFSQFCCTSLWFAGNGVMGGITESFSLEGNALGYLTSAVQLGFIFGTFVFALYTITDRYSPSKVFFWSAIISAVFNLFVVFEFNTTSSLLAFRFVTGVFLAGIYPVGMKIAADYFSKGLGKSLGFLVGALVLGTALPHLLRGLGWFPSWRSVIYATSVLAIFGGIIVLVLVPNGPYRKPASKFDFSFVYKVFKPLNFRSAAFGYFGHMWELYAFWAFLPVVLAAYQNYHGIIEFNTSLISFMVIAIGALGCVLSGYLSQKYTSKNVAAFALGISCVCCILSPFFFLSEFQVLNFIFLVIWGMVVIADSPLFSTLVAQNTEAEVKGTALTIVNSIGFAITIISIQILNTLELIIDAKYLFLILSIGPIFGLMALLKEKKA